MDVRLLNELLGVLLVDDGERGQVGDEQVEQRGLHALGRVADHRVLRQHDVRRRLGVGGQQTPVDVAAVANVGVVAVLRDGVQDVLHQVLRVAGTHQEQLHRGGQQRQLHVWRLVVEAVEEGLQQLVGVVDTVGVLADDPDHGGLGLGLVQRIQVLAQRADDGLVLVRVAAEDVADHDHGLLHHVVGLLLDQRQQRLHTALGHLLQTDGETADGAHGLANDLHIDLLRVALELGQHLLDVALRGELHHDVHLLLLHVDRVVVLAEEHADLRLQHVGTLLHDQVDVAQRHVLDLGVLVRQQRHQWRTHLAHQRADAVLAADVLHVHHHHLNGAQHHGRVAVLQTRLDTLDNGLRLTLVARLVAGQTIQNVHLTPLRGLVQRHHQLLQHRRADLQHLTR